MPTGIAGLEGFAPKVEVGAGNPEALKYGKLWAREEYRRVAPGEQLAQFFLSTARPRPGSEVIDFGCGTGRGALMLALLGQLRVTMVDFVRNCLDADIEKMLTTQAHVMRFVKADLERGPLPVAEYGFCTDVMEHIPPDKVDAVLTNVLRAAQHVFFSISTVDDACGALIGEPLHLTVQPYAWWLKKFQDLGAIVHWSQDAGQAALFYVTAWATGKDFTTIGVLNIEEEQVRANVRHNTAQGWEQIRPHPTNDHEVMILGGGPTMAGFESEIRAKRAAGVKLVTLNGAYTWALEHGLTPSAQVMVDARPFNARFVQPVVEECKYLIASQCDPAVFAGLPKDRTLIWHSNTDLIKDLLDAAYPAWYSVPGGSTVLLRSVPLLRMLGFKRFHLYGCDSCLSGEIHHAYAQPENDGALVIPVSLGGRIFQCHPWMVSQCNEMMDMVRVMGDEIELEIHGDGMLAYALQHAADLQDEQDARAVPMVSMVGDPAQ